MLSQVPLSVLRLVAVCMLASAAAMPLGARLRALRGARARLACEAPGLAPRAQARRPGRCSRAVLSRVAVVSAVVLGSAWLALREPPDRPAAPVVEELRPQATEALPCRVRGDQALTQARFLEQLAVTGWQRVPFALQEAPRALAHMAEAEACYAAAGERAGSMRSAAFARAYQAELQRRFTRARLLLRLASRAHASTRTPQRDEEARRQVATLLALLDRAPASAQPYRRELMRLERSYLVQAAERVQRAERRP